MWLFESLDEVRRLNFRPFNFFSYDCVLKSADFIFYGCALPGSGLARCISVVTGEKNPNIEILKMTVWFVLDSRDRFWVGIEFAFGANHAPRAGSSSISRPVLVASRSTD